MLTRTLFHLSSDAAGTAIDRISRLDNVFRSQSETIGETQVSLSWQKVYSPDQVVGATVFGSRNVTSSRLFESRCTSAFVSPRYGFRLSDGPLELRQTYRLNDYGGTATQPDSAQSCRSALATVSTIMRVVANDGDVMNTVQRIAYDELDATENGCRSDGIAGCKPNLLFATSSN